MDPQNVSSASSASVQPPSTQQTQAPTQAPYQFSSPFTLIRKALSFYFGNKALFFNIGLVSLVLFFIQTGLNFFLVSFGVKQIGYLIIAAIFMFIIGLLSFAYQFVFLPIMIIKATAEIDGGNSPTFTSVFSVGKGLFWSAVGLYFISMLIVMGGMVLLIIPGMILSVYLVFVYNALVLENARGLRAVSMSMYYVKNKWWGTLGRLILGELVILVPVFLIGGIVAAIFISFEGPSSFLQLSQQSNFTFVFQALIQILNIIAMQFLIICGYFWYKELHFSKPAPTEEEFKNRKGFIALAILGVLLPIIIIGSVIGVSFISARHRAQNATALHQAGGVVDLMKISNTGLLEKDPYVSKELGFSANQPKGWKVLPEAGSVLFSSDYEKSGISAVLSVQKAIIPKDVTALGNEQLIPALFAGVVGETKDLVYTKYSRYTNYTGGMTTIYGAEGYIDGTKPGEKINQAFYLIVYSNYVFMLNGRASSSEWPTVEPMLLSMLSTFNIAPIQ